MKLLSGARLTPYLESNHEQKIPRRNLTPAFKAKGALTALKNNKTLAELSQQFDVHANPIVDWKSQLLANAASHIGRNGQTEAEVDVKALHARRFKTGIHYIPVN
jgi:transposase